MELNVTQYFFHFVIEKGSLLIQLLKIDYFKHNTKKLLRIKLQ